MENAEKYYKENFENDYKLIKDIRNEQLITFDTMLKFAAMYQNAKANEDKTSNDSVFVCAAPSKTLPCSHFYSNRCLRPSHCNFKQTKG